MGISNLANCWSVCGFKSCCSHLKYSFVHFLKITHLNYGCVYDSVSLDDAAMLGLHMYQQFSENGSFL